MDSTKKPNLKLIVDNTKIELKDYLDKNGLSEKKESKSEFVNQVSSFCDALDKQIEDIMNM